MLPQELKELVMRTQENGCEGQYIELKKAAEGTPERLYDTLSSFSNQDGGGIIIFGIDESAGYSVCGVYASQALQSRVTEQSEQMNPGTAAVYSVQYRRHDR